MCLCTRPAATVAPFAQLCHDCSLIILHTVSSWLDMCSALDGSSMRSSITHTHTDRIWMLSRLCVGVKRRKVSWNKRPALVRGKETLRTTCDLFERHFRLSTFSLSFFHCGMGRNKRGCWRSVGSVAVRQLAAVDITRDLKQIEENNKKRKWKIKLLQKPLRCHFIYYLLLAWVRRERGKCPFVVSTEIYFPALLMGSCCCRAHAPTPPTLHSQQSRFNSPPSRLLCHTFAIRPRPCREFHTQCRPSTPTQTASPHSERKKNCKRIYLGEPRSDSCNTTNSHAARPGCGMQWVLIRGFAPAVVSQGHGWPGLNGHSLLLQSPINLSWPAVECWTGHSYPSYYRPAVNTNKMGPFNRLDWGH